MHTLRRHCSELRAGMERFQADHDSDLRQLCVERWAGWLSFAGPQSQASAKHPAMVVTRQSRRKLHMPLTHTAPGSHHCETFASMKVTVTPCVLQQHTTAAAAARAGHCTAFAEDGRSVQRHGASARTHSSIKSAQHCHCIHLIAVPSLCMGWYLLCFASNSRVNRVHMRPRSLGSSWACLRSPPMIAVSQTMREVFDSQVHRHLHPGCSQDCSMPQCSSCTE